MPQHPRSTAASRPPILFAASEVTPLIKTGGLADVSAALPKALVQQGCDVRIVLPGYGEVLDRLQHTTPVHQGELAGHRFEVLQTTVPGLPTLWLVCCPALFGRPGNPYLGPEGADWPDNAERFALFGRVIAELACRETAAFRPAVVHLNDWQTGIAGALLGHHADRPAIVFTIHNLHFQGLFDYAWLQRLGLPAEFGTFETLEFHGRLSFIKGGLVFADAITAVSPGYAREIQTPEFGVGLDGLLRHRANDLVGILNGIDTDVWNPSVDPLIAAPYGSSNLHRKRENKRALQVAMQLPVGEAPLLGMVTRLTEQKGIDLVLQALPTLLELGTQLVVLGSGAAHFERALGNAAAAHPTRIAFRNDYDEALAHRIEAGADLFLMPSRFEPCGLNQMYSMAYGTPPIVHRTGGLGDTVRDAGPAEAAPDQTVTGTGFVMEYPEVDELVRTVRRALNWWRNPSRFRALQANAMAQDFGWTSSARPYLELYARVLAERRGATTP